jgi:alkylation response protein AidB-like acyl-CoA dehydrogenase
MLDLIASPEQNALADGVAAFLRDAFPLDRFRSGGGNSEENWHELAQLGSLGVALAEEAGGLGLGMVEDVLAFRELGRSLVSPAAIATRVAACVASACGDTALCRNLLEGRRRAGFVLPAGSQTLLLDAGPDDLCVVIGTSLIGLHEPSSIQEREELLGLDDTLRLARARLDPSPAYEIEDERLALSARLLAAAMLCGLIEQARDMAADYARTRQQFGVPIGMFQGVKHPCADMAVAAEEAWSQVAYAALMLDASAPSSRFDVLAAKLVAGDNAMAATRANIQIHGGMGFTDEVNAQLLLKRAHVLNQLFDDPKTVSRSLLEFPGVV